MAESERQELAGHALAMALRRAYLAWHRRANVHTMRVGATADQFVILTELVREEGLAQKTLAQRIASDANTLAAALKVLEERGWVRRQADPHDARSRRVFLTDLGRTIQGQVAVQTRPLHEALFQAAEQLATEAPSAEPVEFLRRVHDAFSGSPAEPATE